MTEKVKKTAEELKRDVAVLRRAKLQDERFLELMSEELKLMQQLRKFESTNNELVNGKPAYTGLQDYYDLVNKYKDVQLKYKELELNDKIAQLNDRISGADKLISEISRGKTDNIKPAKEVKSNE